MASRSAWSLLGKQQPLRASSRAAGAVASRSSLSANRTQRTLFSACAAASTAPTTTTTASVSRPRPLARLQQQPLSPVTTGRRAAHSIPRPTRTSTPPARQKNNDGNDDSETADPRGLAPHYELTFTCVPCGARSAHNVSKQGYHYGSVLITCPSCRNRHVISDHLGIFGTWEKKGGEAAADAASGSSSPTAGRTIEDILREKGRLVKKGTLGEDGDVEFWEDGTASDRAARLAMEDVMLPQRNSTSKGDEDAADAADANAAPGSTFKNSSTGQQ